MRYVAHNKDIVNTFNIKSNNYELSGNAQKISEMYGSDALSEKTAEISKRRVSIAEVSGNTETISEIEESHGRNNSNGLSDKTRWTDKTQDISSSEVTCNSDILPHKTQETSKIDGSEVTSSSFILVRAECVRCPWLLA